MSRLRFAFLIACLVLVAFIPVTVKASPQEKTIVIALDSGHGGEENGADYYGEKEKETYKKIVFQIR